MTCTPPRGSGGTAASWLMPGTPRLVSLSCLQAGLIPVCSVHSVRASLRARRDWFQYPRRAPGRPTSRSVPARRDSVFELPGKCGSVVDSQAERRGMSNAPPGRRPVHGRNPLEPMQRSGGERLQAKTVWVRWLSEGVSIIGRGSPMELIPSSPAGVGAAPGRPPQAGMPLRSGIFLPGVYPGGWWWPSGLVLLFFGFPPGG